MVGQENLEAHEVQEVPDIVDLVDQRELQDHQRESIIWWRWIIGVVSSFILLHSQV